MSAVLSLPARAAAWWGAWRWVVYLALVLAASAALNVWQWKRSIEAPLEQEIAGRDEALADSAALLSSSRERAETLYIAAARTADRLDKSAAAYDKAARDRPLAPGCGPGAGRMSAVNSTLGAHAPQPPGEVK